ncbi:MAG: hypothetical protein RMN51_04040 [Verrucomicrobiota bacterium]|nr:hypothetical protein [Limisphaera sp.]MDW8381266.1 hypothetical protein [Verrucomicrobiota bacterium]
MSRASAGRNWETYLGDPEGSQYSSLRQINRNNVHRLRLAWIYRSGDGRSDNLTQIQCNPLVIDGVLYATSPALKLFALDAVIGQELWRFEPVQAGLLTSGVGINRGVVFRRNGTEARILYIAGPYLVAVDARTGRLISDFGQNGRVDLRDDLGRDARDLYVVGTSPPALFENLVIVPNPGRRRT